MPFELSMPPAAIADGRSLEMVRVWLAKGKVHCVLKVGFWEEQGANESDCWGVLLADMIHHVANAHESEYGRDPRETIRSVREAFEREMVRPTSKRMGDFVAQRDGAE